MTADSSSQNAPSPAPGPALARIRPAIRDLEPLRIGQVAELGLGDPSVIPLWFGEGDEVTPDFIRLAAEKALAEGKTFYAQAGGIPPLRRAIIDYHKRTYGLTLGPDRITVPGSAMLAIVMALQCLLEPGTNVAVVSPMWPNVTTAIAALGAEPRHVRLNLDGGVWSLDLEKLFGACDARTKAIFLATPGNPTGWVARPEELLAIRDFARARGIAIISDEVYGRLVYDGAAAPSFLSLADPEDLIFVINSLSKSWAMTGWRIGWMVAPASLAKTLNLLTVATNTGATVFAQYGAVAALDQGDDYISHLAAKCRTGRDIVQAKLGQHPRLSLPRIDGAFYAFVKVDGVTNSLAFAQDLVRKHKVGMAPGNAFGPGNDDCLRLCFAQNPARLTEALDRFLGAL